MTVDPVSSAHTPPVGVARTADPSFAALLDRQLRVTAPEDMPTVTFGEMTGVRPSPVVATVAPTPHPVTERAGTVRWPVRGRTTSEFGPRRHPVTGVTRNHDGLDIAAPTGTPVVAAVGGTVTFAGARGGYGNLVIIAHPDGMETRYAHQHALSVTAGQTVRAGERIGSVGSTGMSTGPHLHFEVRRRGTPVDPRTLLAG